MMHVTRATAALGAIIGGVQLGDVDDAGVDALYDALIEHQVLFLPGQYLEPVDQVSFGRRFGELGERHHTYVTHPDTDDVVVLDWQPEDRPDAAEWHSDMTFTLEPPFASIFQAMLLPPVGGDTLWASMYSVHDSLDAGFRRDLESLSATHDPGAFRNGPFASGGIPAMNQMLANVGSAVWPIISHHPVNDRPYINVSESNTRWIIGVGAPESQRILSLLFSLTNRPDHHVRLRWEPGTVAIWDNRATQHYAVSDYAGHRRMMHRVAVARDTRLVSAT
jgi:taurine dioxygenase